LLKNTISKAKRLEEIAESPTLAKEYMEIFGETLYSKAQ